ncbi:MAG TPA: response regulator [Burkholderiales bacterium]|jgi:putative two-component system response regulator|nr:response regulator [Burkholderiales bacterium]
MQIVIVSDSLEQVDALRAMALRAGLKRVECFTHPAAALDWCADNEPDLVLADHMMRACDGLEFLRRLRAMPHLGDVPFVLMLPPVSGLGPVRALAWKLGAADFLTTPVDDTEFVARVRNLLLLRSAALTRAEVPGFSAPPLENTGAHWPDSLFADRHGLAQFH